MEAGVEELPARPRGRRLCLEVAKILSPRVAELVFWLGYELDPGRNTSRVLLTADGGSPAVESGLTVSTDGMAAVLTGMDLPGSRRSRSRRAWGSVSQQLCWA